MTVAAAAVLAAWRLMRPFRVEVAGDSMLPTLRPGDWALAVAPRNLRSGDVVVVEHPERPGFELVKRVAGLAIPDAWRVTGDNPTASTDSTAFGPVAREAVRGRVVAVYWPPERWGIVRRGAAPGRSARYGA